MTLMMGLMGRIVREVGLNLQNVGFYISFDNEDGWLFAHPNLRQGVWND